MTALDHALIYAGRHGWHVFPVRARGKAPITENGKDDASTDPTTIVSWFGNGNGQQNVGISCEPSQIIVVDIDLPKPKNGHSDGRLELAALVGDLGELPATITADTGSGGTHYLFRAPLGVELVGKLGKAIDLIRRGYIVAPPSVHESGNAYRWRAGHAPGEIAIAELPAAWIDYMRVPEPRSSPAAEGTATGEDFYAALESLDQRRVLECVSGTPLVNGERFAFKSTRKHSGKYNLFVDRGEGFEGTSNFIDARGRIGARKTGGKDDGGPLASHWLRWYGRDDATIRRGLIEHVPELARFAKSSNGTNTSHREPPAEHDQNDSSETPRLTELGNAERLARSFGHELRYVAAWGKWLAWDRRRWRRDELGSEVSAAKSIAKSFYAEAAKLADRGGAGDEAAGKLAETIAKWARTSSKASSIRAMVSLAQSESPIAAAAEMFDRDPFAFNVMNGTIDLNTGKLRPHRQTDMITMLAPVAYDPKATCPRWDRFLDRVLPDREVLSWIQRYVGYALTGDVREQCLAFPHGAGANGKSVLFDVLLAIFGDYGLRAAPDLVLAKYGEAHPTELADLEGRRLVVVSEIEQGRAWAESMIKRITGDTTITARKMRQDFYTFEATHKLVIAANTMPTVRGTDHAIWRRMRLVPFTVTIPERERDKELVAKLLEERAGILAWAVRGCLAWQHGGLGSATAIDAATASYRADQDAIGLWIADTSVLSASAWTAMSVIYESYRRWCEAGGRDAWTRETLRARLLEREGLTDHRTKAARGIAGIEVRG